MGMYSDLTDEELVAKKAELRARLEALVGGTGVSKVRGEGRGMDLVAGDAAGVQRLLSDVEREIQNRGGEGLSGHAIGVRF